MKVFEHSDCVEITGLSDFIPEKTFECGQCFRWYVERGGVYTGVALGRVAELRSCGGSVFISGSLEDFEAVWRRYFDFDRNYSKIRQKLCIDDFMKKATGFGEGMRLLCQDKWESLCSFIISQNNNIPRIKTIIDSLCREFGDSLSFKGRQYFTFPAATRLASLDSECLSPLRCGYRAEYIIDAAKKVADGFINLDELAKGSPDNARSFLKQIRGVGNKVADCVLLFGFHMLDAFPLDVWMKRAVALHYGPDFDSGIFSPYAGIAQQYIFHYSRAQGNKRL